MKKRCTQPMLGLQAALILAVGAAAAPVEAPTHWIGDRAAEVVDRVKTATRNLTVWTATVKLETHDSRSGTEKVTTAIASSRYLRGEGSTDFHSRTNPTGVVPLSWQNAEKSYRYGVTARNEFVIWEGLPAASPPESRQPMGFTAAVDAATLVRYAGQETVGGELCDVIETDFISPAKPSTAANPPPLRVTVMRFAINARGIVVQRVSSGSEKDGLWYRDTLTEFDPAAKLTTDDFSEEHYQQALLTALQGRPMPQVIVTQFSPGEPLPPAKFTLWNGRPFQFSELKGKVVVLETWASWCGPCKEAFPYYEQMRQKLAANPEVVFAAMSFDAKQEEYEKWMRAHADAYGFMFGRIDAADATAALKSFRGSLPAFYVIGIDGRIVSAYTGYPYGWGKPDPRLDEALRKAGVLMESR